MGKALKGGAFERAISVLLSEWWTNGQRDDIFWRTANSGGRVTFRMKKGKTSSSHHGDIDAIDPIGKPLIAVTTLELKRGYSKATIADLLDKPKKGAQQTYEEWFEKAERQQTSSGALGWLIIIQRNRRERFVFYPQKLHEALQKAGAILYNNSIFAMFWFGERVVCGVPLDIFLDRVKPEHVLALAAEKQKAA